VGTELPALIFHLVEATGTMDKYLVGEGSSQTIRPLIANLTVYPDFVVVERGDADTAPGGISGWRTASAAPRSWRDLSLRLQKVQKE
jgi:hypothetical protein